MSGITKTKYSADTIASYHGIVKSAELRNIPGKPNGWYVREKYDTALKKTISLEFGIYVDENTFLMVPVHFSMRGFFQRSTIEDEPCGENAVYRYLVVPNETKFGLATFISKKDNLEHCLLVPANAKHPPVVLFAYAYSSDKDILSFNFLMYNGIKILSKKIDKDREYIAFVGFTTEVGPAETMRQIIIDNESELDTNIHNAIYDRSLPVVAWQMVEGIRGGTKVSVTTAALYNSGFYTDTNIMVLDHKVSTEYINFHMYPDRDRSKVGTDDLKSDPTAKPKKKKY